MMKHISFDSCGILISSVYLLQFPISCYINVVARTYFFPTVLIKKNYHHFLHQNSMTTKL